MSETFSQGEPNPRYGMNISLGGRIVHMNPTNTDGYKFSAEFAGVDHLYIRVAQVGYYLTRCHFEELYQLDFDEFYNEMFEHGMQSFESDDEPPINDYRAYKEFEDRVVLRDVNTNFDTLTDSEEALRMYCRMLLDNEIKPSPREHGEILEALGQLTLFDKDKHNG